MRGEYALTSLKCCGNCKYAMRIGKYFAYCSELVLPDVLSTHTPRHCPRYLKHYDDSTPYIYRTSYINGEYPPKNCANCKNLRLINGKLICTVDLHQWNGSKSIGRRCPKFYPKPDDELTFKCND